MPSIPVMSSSESPPADQPAQPRLRVLIVDDDQRVLTALRETIVLESDLHVVGQAGDAAAALRVARTTDPAVVLLDVLLPDDVTGLELVAALSNRPGCSVVAMSIRSDPRRAALAAGAVDFVDKGDDIDAILRAVRAAGGLSG